VPEDVSEMQQALDMIGEWIKSAYACKEADPGWDLASACLT